MVWFHQDGMFRGHEALSCLVTLRVVAYVTVSLQAPASTTNEKAPPANGAALHDVCSDGEMHSTDVSESGESPEEESWGKMLW